MYTRATARIMVLMAIGSMVFTLRQGALPAQPVAQNLKIGVLDNLFDTKNQMQIEGQLQPLAEMVRNRTKTRGTFHVVESLDQLMLDLKANKLQMAVVSGFEYGWAREMCPDAKPLLLAINEAPTMQAALVVPKGSPAQRWEDLKGKNLALSKQTPYHVRFYLERLVGGPLETAFQVKQYRNANAAMEAVGSQEADVTVVASNSVRSYQSLQPQRFNLKMRVLTESAEFPSPVLLYRPGAVAEDVIDRFEKAMLTAHEDPASKVTLTHWKLSAFIKVPADYENKVNEIIRIYPRNAR